MDHPGLHERTVQVGGPDFMETRRFFYDPANHLTIVAIEVTWHDGTTSDMSYIIEGDMHSAGGSLRYPDPTMSVTIDVYPDGRVTIHRGKLDLHENTRWDYQPDGFAEVTHYTNIPLDLGGGKSTTYWSLAPDGSPVGDVRQSILTTVPGQNHLKYVDIIRSRDGTVTTQTRIYDLDTKPPEPLLDETTVVKFDPNPQPPINGTLPSRPTPSPGTGGGIDPVKPTTREPHPVRPGGGGWVGSGGPVIVEHITDWWYEDTNGTITYLGSTVNEKTKEM